MTIVEEPLIEAPGDIEVSDRGSVAIEADPDAGSGIDDPTAGMTPEEKSVHAKRWWTLGVLCLSLVVIGVDNTILNVALPTLVTDIGATTSQLQWIVDGYTLVFAGLLLTMGSLGDRFGRRGALTIGLVIFGLGSVASAFTSTAGALIATRSFMGLGAALMMPATLSIVTNVFRDPKERGRAIAIWAGFSAAGIAFGPLLGGWLLEHFYWGSVFWVNVPIVIAALIGGRLFVPTSRDPEAPKLDPVGAVLSIVGLVTLLWGIIEGPGKGWGSAEVLGALAVGVVSLVAFALWENHSDHPMLDVKFFKKARFSAASIAVTLVFFAMLGSLFMLTQYLQFVLGYSALEAGIRIMPFALTMMVVAPLSARIVERIGTKITVTGGLVIIAIGLGLFATLQVDSAYVQLLGALVVLAGGMGLVMAPATESIMGSLPPGKAGVGSAVNDTTRQMGGALGVAVLGSAFASVYSSKITDALSGAGLPVEAVTGAQESMGGALHAAAQMGGPAGDQLVLLAREAFVQALHPAVLVGAAVALVGAVITAVFLPARAVDPVEAVIQGDYDDVNALTTPDLADHVDRSVDIYLAVTSDLPAGDEIVLSPDPDPAVTASTAVRPKASMRLRRAAVRDDGAVGEPGERDVGEQADPETAPWGRPRSVEADRAILAAAAELLEEAGFERLTMEAVAHRAGVGKATLYRRWSNKVDLVVDVISLAFQRYPIADTGDTREDLLVMSQRALSIIEGRVGRIMQAVSSELGRNDALAEAVRTSLMEPRREALRTVVRRGIERGDIRPDIDPDLVLDSLVGALYYRIQVTDQSPTPADAEALVDLLFRGMAAG